MKVTKLEIKDALKGSHRKDNPKGYKVYQLIAFEPDLKKGNRGFSVIVDLRIYQTGGQRVYACVWINDRKNNIHGSGSDFVSGYNYDLDSASASLAFKHAGIEFDEPTDNGREGIINALEAIGKYLGHANYFVNDTHP